MDDKKTSNVAEKIIGNHQNFTIENRCLIGGCFFSAIVFFISTIVNYLIGLPTEMISGSLLFGILFSSFYYFSRFKCRFLLVYWFVLISSCLFVSLSWFSTGGISGPSIIISLIILACVNLIATKQQRILSILIIVLNLGLLFSIEHIHPDLIKAYQSHGNRFIDNYVTFLIAVFIISFIINYAMRHFRFQKSKMEQATKIIQEREEQFRLLIESAPDAIFVHHNSKFTYMNAGAVKLFGATNINDVIGTSILKRIHPNYLSVAHQRIQQLNNKENTPRLRILYLRMDESPIEVEVSAVPINFHKKDSALVFARDISDRREVEDRLEHQNQQLQTILKDIPFGYVYMEVPSGKIVHNNAAETIIENPNIPVENIYEFIRYGAYHSDGRQFEASDYPVAQVLNTGEQSFRKKIYYPVANETTIILVNSAYPIHNHKYEIIGVISLFENITSQYKAKEERSRLKEQLYQAQKKEAIGTLAGGIAHDFNNILSGMLAYSQLTKMHIKDFNKADSNIDQVIKGIRRAADLVQQILIFSRQTEYEKRTLKISLVVKEALKLLRVSIPSTIIIEENIATNSRVMADPTQIHQVVMNLCTNAYHSMQKAGGVLTVKLKEIKLSKQDSILGWDILPGNYVRLEIKDTGQGMDPYILNKIFEPYFTTKTVGKGTGLGLAIVYGIIEDHNGYIDVYSKPNKGTTFKVFFPILEKNRDSISPITKEKPLIGGTERIMLVDDDQSILESSRELLEEYGYKISCFPDGAQAFVAFENNPQGFDIIITDMTMPHMTGYELSAKIFNIRPGLPIILCTGYSESISEAAAIKLGIFKYVEKPIDIKKLMHLLREILDKKWQPI